MQLHLASLDASEKPVLLISQLSGIVVGQRDGADAVVVCRERNCVAQFAPPHELCLRAFHLQLQLGELGHGGCALRIRLNVLRHLEARKEEGVRNVGAAEAAACVSLARSRQRDDSNAAHKKRSEQHGRVDIKRPHHHSAQCTPSRSFDKALFRTKETRCR